VSGSVVGLMNKHAGLLNRPHACGGVSSLIGLIRNGDSPPIPAAVFPRDASVCASFFIHVRSAPAIIIIISVDAVRARSRKQRKQVSILSENKPLFFHDNSLYLMRHVLARYPLGRLSFSRARYCHLELEG